MTEPTGNKKRGRPRRKAVTSPETQDAQQSVAGKAATLHNVAKLADVSVMTVSNVINGRYRLMSAKTRLEVEGAIKKLGYRPHTNARSLRLSKRLSVGLMIVDPSPTFIADAFTTHIMAGLGNYLSKRGYALEVQGVTPDRVEASTLFRWHQCDCLCVVASGDKASRKELYSRLAELSQPIVVLQDEIPTNLEDAVSVRQDDREGGWILARHLIERGCRKLLYFKESQPWPALDHREAGIRGALATVSQGSLDVLTASGASFEMAVETLKSQLQLRDPPDAILGSNDQLGIAALQFLQSSGRSIPQDIKITGFNAFDFRHYSTPNLTTIKSAAYDLGEAAATALLHRLTTGKFESREIKLPVSFVEGAST